jgi:Tfp pilus assembly PilM family ATPase
MLNNRHSFIGLDIGSRCIKAVQAKRTRSQSRIEAAAVIPFATPEPTLDAACVRRIHDVFARQGFHGNRVVIVAPADKLHVELLDLPPRSSGAPIDQLARAEMIRLSKLEGNAFEMATWDLPAPPRGGTGTALMAVAASHADTQGAYHTFESEGLSVEAIDVQACAIARACRTRTKEGTTAVLDLGFSHAGLWFIRDGVVVFQRTFAECGTKILQAELMKRLSVDAEVVDHLINRNPDEPKIPQAATVDTQIGRYVDVLAEELKSSFAYINHRYNDSPPATMFVIGGGGMSAALRSGLKDRLSMEIQPLAPMALMECGPELLEKCTAPLLTTALGLALYEGD